MIARIVSSAIVSSVIVVCGWASSASAQDDFCATAASDLIVALDGGWTIQQGPGVAMGGGMQIPLPPSAAGVTFTYDPQKGVVDMTGADLSDNMIMFPSAEGQKAGADSLIADVAAPADSGCDWYALPSLIGTNVYNASDTGFVVYGTTAKLCTAVAAAAAISGVLVDASAPGMDVCQDAIDNPSVEFSDLQMEMTVVVRFASLSHGSGMVFFEGKQDGRPFRASAPIEFVR